MGGINEAYDITSKWCAFGDDGDGCNITRVLKPEETGLSIRFLFRASGGKIDRKHPVIERMIQDHNALAGIDNPAEFVAKAKRNEELLEEAADVLRLAEPAIKYARERSIKSVYPQNSRAEEAVHYFLLRLLEHLAKLEGGGQ